MHLNSKKVNVKCRRKIIVPYKADQIKRVTSRNAQDLQSSISYAGGSDLGSIRKVDYVIVKIQFRDSI